MALTDQLPALLGQCSASKLMLLCGGPCLRAEAIQPRQCQHGETSRCQDRGGAAYVDTFAMRVDATLPAESVKELLLASSHMCAIIASPALLSKNGMLELAGSGISRATLALAAAHVRAQRGSTSRSAIQTRPTNSSTSL